MMPGELAAVLNEWAEWNAYERSQSPDIALDDALRAASAQLLDYQRHLDAKKPTR